jgi:Flp pilus assembly protein TadG
MTGDGLATDHKSRKACAAAGLTARFIRDRRASSAVEFAIVCGPFFLMLLGIMQLGIFYMAQSALDTAVLKTVETLRGNFNTGTTATLMDATALKNSIVTNAGGLVSSGTVSVEIQPLTNLSGAVVAITNGTVDYGTSSSALVLRAQASVVTFTPGLNGLSTVISSAMIRRQGT